MLHTNRGLAGALGAMLCIVGLAALAATGVPETVIHVGMPLLAALGGAHIIRNRDS